MSTATELRKNLFQELERAANGETVSFTYKGAKLRIVLEPGEPRPSKLARLMATPYTPAPLASDEELINTKDLWMQAWEAKWDRRFAQEAKDYPEGADEN